MEEYYRKLFKERGLPLRVGVSSSGGKGLFAESSFTKAATVFTEVKLCGIQNKSSRPFPACAHCLRFIGKTEDFLYELHKKNFRGKKVPPLPTLLHKPEYLERLRIRCKWCPEEYCSPQCAATASVKSHILLCSGGSWKQSFAKEVDIWRQDLEASNEIFFLAAQVLASVITAAHQQGLSARTLEEAFFPYSLFVSELWWDQVQLPSDLTEEDRPEFVEGLKESATRSLTLLTAFLIPRALTLSSSSSSPSSQDDLQSALNKLCSVDVFARLIGAFEMNNLGRVAISPLQCYMDHISTLPSQLQDEAKAAAGEWWTLIKSKKFLSCRGEGTGLYEIGCTMNHSCEPNIALLKPPNCLDDTTAFIALRDITPEDELFISYIDQENGLSVRRSLLRDYLFECNCTRCAREEAEGGADKPEKEEVKATKVAKKKKLKAKT